jgi:D-serine deaminase-like pyridoxal phosphate-dependent protein
MVAIPELGGSSRGCPITTGSSSWPTGPRPDVGRVVLVVPNHICPVVDLFASFLVVKDGEIVPYLERRRP